MTFVAIVASFDTGRWEWRCGRGPERLVAELPAGVEVRRVNRAAITEPEPGGSFTLQSVVADEVAAVRSAGALPVILSGNCNTGVLGGVIGLARAGAGRIGIAWFDAHGEGNTPETSASGWIDGMGLTMALGQCWQGRLRTVDGYAPVAGERVALIGARDFDPGEPERLEAAGVTLVPPGDEDALARVLPRLATADAVHLHVDPDAYDTDFGVGNSFASAGGLGGEELAAAVARVAASCPLASMSVASYEPEGDPDGVVASALGRLVETVTAAA